MLSALKQWLKPNDAQFRAHTLYAALPKAARRDAFYVRLGVEDTLDGRFDVVVLHLCLLLERLGREEQTAALVEFERLLTEAFFDDMDRTLREMGVSDTGVGHRVKKMAQAFYGRKKAYLEASSEQAVQQALARNLYREREVGADTLSAMTAYVQASRAMLAAQRLDLLFAGSVTFPEL